MYVVDTNVLSHVSPTKAQADPGILGWLERNGEHLYLSVVSITEVSYGIAWLRHRGATRKAANLAAWLTDVLVFYGSRLLPIDAEIALRAGELIATARAAGVEVDAEDAWIAATADLRGMTVLSGNLRHFRPMGVSTVNPFDALPPDVR